MLRQEGSAALEGWWLSPLRKTVIGMASTIDIEPSFRGLNFGPTEFEGRTRHEVTIKLADQMM